MKRFEELCLASHSQTKSGVYKKNPLTMPHQITFSSDPQGLQDMMNKDMHPTMIDQSKASSVPKIPIKKDKNPLTMPHPELSN
jgi:hypothetical protein